MYTQDESNNLNLEIAGCERCPQRLIEYRWLPVGYFGAFRTANIWVVSINPSHREFLGKDGHLLRGRSKQRFSVLDDDLSCSTRPEFASRHLPVIIDHQDNFYRRNPYRGFFNRLGSFLLDVHDIDDPEPLRPFRSPLPGNWLYCHMDIIKCATRQLWSDLPSADQALLRKNCQGYLARQLHKAPQLQWILVNGKSAMESVGMAFLDIGFDLRKETVQLGSHGLTLWRGSSPMFPDVHMFGWSANVVNGHITKHERSLLANLVRIQVGIL